MKIDKRKEYWDNNYFGYWKDRVNILSSNPLSKTDIHPPDINIFKKYYRKTLNFLSGISGGILDVGVGFGRFIPVYKVSFGSKIWGVDISEQMTKEAQKSYPYLRKKLLVASAEALPFPKNIFSLLICWEVFDATFQEQALWEFQRVLKLGGVALVTGKNTNYLQSDIKAYIAEVNARKKNHPNFFTDTKLLIKKIDDFGFKVEKFYPFRKRGDLSDNNPASLNNKCFYQYVLIIKKIRDVFRCNLNYKIAHKYSRAYRRKDKVKQ